MDSVQCRIANKSRLELWIEIEIGINDDNNRFWKLTRQNYVSFSNFTSTSGSWDYSVVSTSWPDGSDNTSNGIAISGDGSDGFALQNVPEGFYRLNCGNTRSGDGFRLTDGVNVRYRMDVLCV
jgi:hypothetical protein